MTKGRFFALQTKHKVNYVALLFSLYTISLIFVTVGFFSSSWYKSSAADNIDCGNSIGLVSGGCRYPYPSLDKYPARLGYVLLVVFWLMFTVICILFVSSIFLILAVVFRFYKNEVFLTFMAIVFGVFYPAATIMVNVACIYSMGSFPFDISSALILSEVGGGLMFIVCLMMRGYDKLFKPDNRVTNRVRLS